MLHAWKCCFSKACVEEKVYEVDEDRHESSRLVISTRRFVRLPPPGGEAVAARADPPRVPERRGPSRPRGEPSLLGPPEGGAIRASRDSALAYSFENHDARQSREKNHVLNIHVTLPTILRAPEATARSGTRRGVTFQREPSPDEEEEEDDDDDDDDTGEDGAEELQKGLEIDVVENSSCENDQNETPNAALGGLARLLRLPSSSPAVSVAPASSSSPPPPLRRNNTKFFVLNSVFLREESDDDESGDEDPSSRLTGSLRRAWRALTSQNGHGRLTSSAAESASDESLDHNIGSEESSCRSAVWGQDWRVGSASTCGARSLVGSPESGGGSLAGSGVTPPHSMNFLRLLLMQDRSNHPHGNHPHRHGLSAPSTRHRGGGGAAGGGGA